MTLEQHSNMAGPFVKIFEIPKKLLTKLLQIIVIIPKAVISDQNRVIFFFKYQKLCLYQNLIVAK